MGMSPFVKGVLGFFGCAVLTTAIYHVGKSRGREEALRDVEREERYLEAVRKANAKIEEIKAKDILNTQREEEAIIPVEDVSSPPLVEPQSAVERVRKMKGIKGTIFGGTSVIKELLRNPDGKKLVMTVENGEIVARISQNQGG